MKLRLTKLRITDSRNINIFHFYENNTIEIKIFKIYYKIQAPYTYTVFFIRIT